MPEMSGDLAQMFQAAWPILLMVAIFYFLLYRPQKRDQKKRANMLDNLKREDKIVTIGGIHGTISSLNEKTVMLRIAEKLEVKVSRSAISHYQDPSKNEK